MVVSKVPEKFLNLPRLALMNAALGVVSIISQIVSISIYYFYLDSIGAGIWGGLIFIATAAFVFKINKNGGDGWLLGFTLMLSGTSLLCGFLLLAGFNGNYVFTLPTYWGLYWYSSVLAMSVILMVCGIASIFVNALIGYSLIKHLMGNIQFKPPVQPVPSLNNP